MMMHWRAGLAGAVLWGLGCGGGGPELLTSPDTPPDAGPDIDAAKPDGNADGASADAGTGGADSGASGTDAGGSGSGGAGATATSTGGGATGAGGSSGGTAGAGGNTTTGAGTTGGGTGGTTSDATSGGTDTGTDAGASDASADATDWLDASVPRDAFCAGGGPAITVPTGGADSAPTCTGNVARDTFANALCTCENTYFAGYLNTGSWSSDEAETVFVKQGGPVGVNGTIATAGYLDVGGTLRVFGSTDVEVAQGQADSGYIHVHGDLEANGPMALAGFLQVERDAYIQEALILGLATVDGTLHTPSLLPPSIVAAGLVLANQAQLGPLDLEPPCPCEPEELLDIAGITADGALHNDNADPAVSLDPGSLAGLVGYREVTLPCGRFYVDEISGVGDVTLNITGRTALFVGGDVSTVGKFEVNLEPGAELDLFIGGNLTQVGYSPFGDPSRPADVRVYVAGSEVDGVFPDIVMVGYEPFGANLYAPRSRLYSPGFIDAKGSLFVRELHAQGYVKIDYDRAVLDRNDDEECFPPEPPEPPEQPEEDAGEPEPPPPECTDICESGCGGARTCVDGMCGTCRTSADCCAPLICYEDGRCGALLY